MYQYADRYCQCQPSGIPYAIQLYSDDFDVMVLAYGHFQKASDRLKADKMFVRCVLERIIEDPGNLYNDALSRHEQCRALTACAAEIIHLDLEIGRLARDIYAFEHDVRFSNDRSFVMEAMMEIETWDIYNTLLLQEKYAIRVARLGHGAPLGGAEIFILGGINVGDLCR